MTLDVYAQLQERVKREHGRAFDTLVRRAREQLYVTTSGALRAGVRAHLRHESGHEATLGESDEHRDAGIGEPPRAAPPCARPRVPEPRGRE
jgi:hypothetical protein